METKEILKQEVERRYKELNDYTVKFNSKALANRTKFIEENKEKFKSNPESINIGEIAQEMFYVSGFHQLDVRHLQQAFKSSYDLYTKVCGGEGLDESVNTTAAILDKSLPKQIYVLDSGEFKEVTEGTVAKLNEEYQTKNFAKMFENQIKELLNE